MMLSLFMKIFRVNILGKQLQLIQVTQYTDSRSMDKAIGTFWFEAIYSMER